MAGFDTSIFRQERVQPLDPVNALMRGLQVQGAQQGNALQQIQMQAFMQRAQQEQQDRQRTQTDQGLMTRLLGMPIEGQMPQGMQGPGAPMRNQGVDPQTFLRQGGSMGGLPGVMGLNQALVQPARKVTVSKPGDIARYDDGTEAWKNPAEVKPAAKPSAVQEFEYGQQNPAFNDWSLRGKRAGATNVTVPVNMGQKGYDNESKLRNDFKSEPIYKDYQDMAVASKQIKAALTSKTPIGDTAAATKIMKLLDPGSVVRESELAIAMAAAGKLDRLQNYLQMKVSGESLTPTQRRDFGSLADELFAAAGQAYNSKRDEYATMAKRYELDPTSLGAPHAGGGSVAPKPAAPSASNLTSQEAAELQELRARFRGK